MKSKPYLDQMNRETAFEHIYKENYPRIIGLCLGYVKGDEALAKDLAQEVFIKVWENLPYFRNQAKISTWIYRIAVNTCLQELRKKKYLELKTDIATETVSHSMEKETRFQNMYRCINALNAENKTIVLLELDNVPQSEIATIIGISHSAVRTRLHRIKEQLSKCVEHE